MKGIGGEQQGESRTSLCICCFSLWRKYADRGKDIAVPGTVRHTQCVLSSKLSSQKTIWFAYHFSQYTLIQSSFTEILIS